MKVVGCGATKRVLMKNDMDVTHADINQTSG